MIAAVFLLALAATAQAQPSTYDLAVSQDLQGLNLKCIFTIAEEAAGVAKDIVIDGKDSVVAITHLIKDLKECGSDDEKFKCITDAIKDSWEDNKDLRDHLFDLTEKLLKIVGQYSTKCKSKRTPFALHHGKNEFDEEDFACYGNFLKQAFNTLLSNPSLALDTLGVVFEDLWDCTYEVHTNSCVFEKVVDATQGKFSDKLQEQLEKFQELYEVLDQELAKCFP